MSYELARALLLAEIVSPQAIERALYASIANNLTLPKALLDTGALGPDELDDMLSRVDAPVVRNVVPLADLVARLPPGLCQRLLAVPIRRDALTGTIDVAVADARDTHAVREIEHHLGAPVRLVRASIAHIEDALARKSRTLPPQGSMRPPLGISASFAPPRLPSSPGMGAVSAQLQPQAASSRPSAYAAYATQAAQSAAPPQPAAPAQYAQPSQAAPQATPSTYGTPHQGTPQVSPEQREQYSAQFRHPSPGVIPASPPRHASVPQMQSVSAPVPRTTAKFGTQVQPPLRPPQPTPPWGSEIPRRADNYGAMVMPPQVTQELRVPPQYSQAGRSHAAGNVHSARIPEPAETRPNVALAAMHDDTHPRGGTQIPPPFASAPPPHNPNHPPMQPYAHAAPVQAPGHATQQDTHDYERPMSSVPPGTERTPAMERPIPLTRMSMSVPTNLSPAREINRDGRDARESAREREARQASAYPRDARDLRDRLPAAQAYQRHPTSLPHATYEAEPMPSLIPGPPPRSSRAPHAPQTAGFPFADGTSILAALRNADDRDHILELVLSGARAVARKVAVFVVKRGGLVGWTCSPEFGNRAELQSLLVPLTVPSIFTTAMNEGLYLGAIRHDEVHAPVLRVMNGASRDVAVAPIRVVGKAAALVIADELGDTMIATRRLEEIARAAGEAFARVVKTRR